MRTTTKYNKIIQGFDTSADDSAMGSIILQPLPVLANRNFDVIATEVRAIIAKAYEADETNSTHP